MKQKYSVSIVIVSLNTKNKFKKTILSAYNQTYPNKEIIVVDGLSSDGSIKEIYKLKKYISKFIIEKDKGIYDAMNKGIKLSSNKWLIFLNSGDYFFNKDVLKNIFKNEIPKKKNILFGDTIVSQGSIKYIEKAKIFSNTTSLMPFCHQSVLVNRSIMQKRNFSLNYHYSSDFDFFIRCYLKKMFFHNLNLTISVVSSGGLSDTNRHNVYNENIKILLKIKKHFLVFILYKLKIFNFLKDIIKFILPTFVNKMIIKIKYSKNLYKK